MRAMLVGWARGGSVYWVVVSCAAVLAAAWAPAIGGGAAAFYAVACLPLRGASGVRASRVDGVERLVAKAYRMSKAGAFRATPELCGLAGCGPKDLALVLGALGYVAEVEEAGVTFHRRPRRPARARKRARGTGRGRREASAPSPFAKLRDLDLGR